MIITLLIIVLMGFVTSVLLTPIMIGKNFIQPIRCDGPKDHLSVKSNTPTLGGLAIMLTSIAITILFCYSNNAIDGLVVLFITIAFFAIGAIDDILKIFYLDNYKGVSPRIKLILQSLVSIIGIYILLEYDIIDTNITIKNIITVELGYYYYLIFATFIIVGTANAVNLTDGLDGLVSIPAILVLTSFIIIALIMGDHRSAMAWGLEYRSVSEAIPIFSAGMIGAILGFLWYNCNKASIFMGDIGSMPIGAMIAIIAIILKIEMSLLIFGALFVIEAMSVIIQVCHYKITERRVFRMSPIHHHFEYLGWDENKIVVRFWIMSIIFTIVGFIYIII